MGYKLYSENGFVCDLASITGYDDLVNFIGRFSGHHDLKDFIKEGKTQVPTMVRQDIDTLLPYTTNITIRSTLGNLRIGIMKCDEIGIISE